MAKSETISADEWKWKVQSAAGTIIEHVQVKKQMKNDSKFRKAVSEELQKRLAETQKAVTDTKEAVKKT
jgi:hypothetical protein